MRAGKILLVTVALLGFSVSVSAQGMHGRQNQMNNQNSPKGMMGGSGGMMGMMSQMHGGQGMMSGMMGGGQGMMDQQIPSVKTILVQANLLNLTDDQVTVLQKQAVDLKKQVIQLRADAQIARIDLGQTLKASAPNQKDAEKALENRNEKQLDIQKAQLDSYFKGLKVLTAEQQKQVTAFGNGCMMMQGMNRATGQNSSNMNGMMQQQPDDNN